MSFVATNKSNGKMKHPAISFKKLDHKEELIASFKPRIPKNRLQERRGIVIEQGELISLRFTSKNLDLDFYFDAPYEMKVSHLHNQLINHFSMYEHVIIDYSQFPTGESGGVWQIDWTLTISGRALEVDYFGTDNLSDIDIALRDIDLKENSRLGFKINWYLVRQFSSGGGNTDDSLIEPPDFTL